MRERAVVHVAGPPGCRKTTFIESVLGAVGGLIVAARCVRDDTRRHARETAPNTHLELRRYRHAGASGAALFLFPESDIGSEAFFMTELMADYSQGVALEGNNPLGYVDRAVFVAPPPVAGEGLFVRRTSDRTHEQRGKVDAIERLLYEPDDVAELLGDVVGGPIVEFARKCPKLMEDMSANLFAGIAAMRKAPQPKPTQHWAISDQYSGIEHAQLVVVNIRHDSERGAGEQLVADLVRLPKDLARVRRAFRSKTR